MDSCSRGERIKLPDRRIRADCRRVDADNFYGRNPVVAELWLFVAYWVSQPLSPTARVVNLNCAQEDTVHQREDHGREAEQPWVIGGITMPRYTWLRTVLFFFMSNRRPVLISMVSL